MDHQFTAREQEILALVLKGDSNKEIAQALELTSRTVEYHLSKIYAKLGVASRIEAVIKLSEPDLRDPERESGFHQGKPQLKKERKGDRLFYAFHPRPTRAQRNPMKTFVRITILFLLAILVVILILGAFMLLQDALNPFTP
jgi:DNA-binding CsgD family transcriptional regulator